MPRIDIEFDVNEQVIKRVDDRELVAGGKNYFWAKFNLCETWSGISGITAGFTKDNVIPVQMILYEGDGCLECKVPYEVMSDAGIFKVGIYGGDRLLTNLAPVRVKPGVPVDSMNAEEPTPTLVEQLIQVATEAKDIAESVREDADNGVFDGEKGEKGDKGDPGKSGGVKQQSDYDMNDESDSSFIKNRPFYAEIKHANIVFTPTDTYGEKQVLNMKVDIDINKTYIGRAYMANGSTMDVPCALTDASAELELPAGTVITCELLGNVGTIIFGAALSEENILVGDYVTIVLNTTRQYVTNGEFLQLDESTGEYVNVTGVTEVIKKIDNKFINFPIISSSVRSTDKNAVSSEAVYEHVSTQIAGATSFAQTLFDRVPNSIEQRDLVYDVTLTDEVGNVYTTVLKEFNSIIKYAKRLFVHIEVPFNDYEDNALYIEIPMSGTDSYLYVLNKFVPLNNTTFVDVQIEHIGGQSIFSLYSFFNSSDNPSYDNPIAVSAYKENKMEVRSFVTTSSFLSPTGFYGIKFNARRKLPVGTKIKVWGEYEV